MNLASRIVSKWVTPFKVCSALIAVLLGLSLTASAAQEVAPAQKTIGIPLPITRPLIKKPSEDLIYNGATLNSGEASDLYQSWIDARSGKDLSDLDPEISKFWKNKKQSASNADQLDYPANNTEQTPVVKFQSYYSPAESAAELKVFDFFRSLHWVEDVKDPNKVYRMTLSLFAQPLMMRSGLLRKLGYNILSPKYYKKIKILFPSEDKKEEFISIANVQIGVNMQDRGWIIKNDKSDHSLTMVSIILEKTSPDYFDLYFGSAPDPQNPKAKASLETFSKERPFRALLASFALVDVPESVNRYSVTMTSVKQGQAIINHYRADSFAAITYEDMRWVLKRMETLDDADWDEILALSDYQCDEKTPTRLGELVKAKLYLRLNNTMEVFNLPGRKPILPIDLSSSVLKDGKVIKERFKGCPQRFSHGDRDSIFDGLYDLLRIFNQEFDSSVVQSALDQVNKALDLYSANDHYKEYLQDLQKRVTQQIQAHPDQPIYSTVEPWGGPVGNVIFNAGRHITTGTYTGSTAAVQLVDSLSAGVSLGYVEGLAGVRFNTLPIAQATYQYQRDYTHVRPLLSIKEGGEVKWTDRIVPLFMSNLGKILEATEKIKDTQVDGESGETLEQTIYPIDKFLRDMRDGEVFSITDSVVYSVGLQATTPLTALLSLTPLTYLNTLSFGGDVARIELKQVSFNRVVNSQFNGVQIFIRTTKDLAKGAEFNVNFYLNLLKARVKHSNTDINTDAFLIEYNPSDSAQASDDSEIGLELGKLRPGLTESVMQIFRHNSTESLYHYFRHKMFNVKHELETKTHRMKFFAFKYMDFEEDHTMRLTYPDDSVQVAQAINEANSDQEPVEPEKIPMVERITDVQSSKAGRLTGYDWYGLFFDAIGAFISHKTDAFGFSIQRPDNPANTPFGKARWNTVTSERDISVKPDDLPVTLVQNVWGGWSIKTKDFFEIVKEIKKMLKGTILETYEVINENEFALMEKLDFYRITMNLSLLEGGEDRLKELILPPSEGTRLDAVTNKIKNAWNQFFGGDDKGVSQDRLLVDRIISLYGNGNLDKGMRDYYKDCKAKSKIKNKGPQFYYGQQYPCLSDWTVKLINLSRNYPANDAKLQTQWMRRVADLLQRNMPVSHILNYLGPQNYVFYVRINGFRSKDENGDIEYFSKTLGDPDSQQESANGIMAAISRRTKILFFELDSSRGGLQ